MSLRGGRERNMSLLPKNHILEERCLQCVKINCRITIAYRDHDCYPSDRICADPWHLMETLQTSVRVSMSPVRVTRGPRPRRPHNRPIIISNIELCVVEIPVWDIQCFRMRIRSVSSRRIWICIVNYPIILHLRIPVTPSSTSISSFGDLAVREMIVSNFIFSTGRPIVTVSSPQPSMQRIDNYNKPYMKMFFDDNSSFYCSP